MMTPHQLMAASRWGAGSLWQAYVKHYARHAQAAPGKAVIDEAQLAHASASDEPLPGRTRGCIESRQKAVQDTARNVTFTSQERASQSLKYEHIRAIGNLRVREDFIQSDFGTVTLERVTFRSQ